MTISNAEFRGDLIVSCTLDGTPVEYLDPEWTGSDFANFAARSGGGAVILNAFLPGAGLVVGGLVGAYSFLQEKGDGYYDHTGKKHHTGALYRKDFTWS